jgi:hypothetical protein
MEKDNPLFIDDTRYLGAKSLIEALSAYSNADTLKAYDESYGTNKNNKTKFAPVVMAIGETLSNIETLSDVQSGLLAELKKQVTELVRNKALIPTGFNTPRTSTSKPETLPVEAFLLGEVNWDKSEVTYNNLEFSAVRLVEDDAQKIKSNNFYRSGGLAIKIKKSDKSNFSDLGPNSHLNEKEAASYLGVSNRVLQGFRVKGGGPEFVKIGQAIRYKIADLTKWIEKN